MAKHIIEQTVPDLSERPNPTNGWLNGFLSRNPDLKVNPVKTVESARTDAVHSSNISEHIARIISAMDRYNITKPKQVFNFDESGVSFKSMCVSNRTFAVGPRDHKLVHTMVKTKIIDRVTVLSVISADGKNYKPAIVFPGK